MDRLKLFLPILGLTVCLSMTACSSFSRGTQRPGYFLTVSYSSGGNGPIVYDLYFYGDGRLELDGFGVDPPWRSKLTLRESTRLTELLESRGFEEARAIAEARDYHSGCCDMEDVVVEYRGRRLDFPCGEEAPKALQDLRMLVNDIAGSHFRLWGFIHHDCLVGKEELR
jgi:hypothetical protein